MHSGAFSQSDSLAGRLFKADLSKILQDDSSHSNVKALSSLAGFRETDLRDAPGSVVIITREQITASGARDLMDILLLAPGIQLGRDVDDVIGVGIRGLWANEGKCQFMLNGIPLNELDFGTFALGARIPVENISRIEIMSGAGSVIHGGMAALGVINIITRDAFDFNGIHFNLQSGISNGKRSLNSLSMNGNHKVGRDVYINYSFNLTDALRSTWNLPLPDGRMVNYGDSTSIFSQSYYLGIRRGGLNVKFYSNDYQYHVNDAPHNVMMRSTSTDVEYKGTINPKWQYRARGLLTYQTPWQNTNTSDPDLLATNTLSQRANGTISFDYHRSARYHYTSGIQVFNQISSIQADGPGMVFSMNNSRTFSFNDVALFGEVNIKTRFGNLTGGGRLEYNPFTNWMFAPRIVYNKIINAFHVKAIYGSAFKTPTIQNVNLGPDDMMLSPERVHTTEIEVGFRPEKDWDITANIHKTDLIDPIVYVYDSVQFDNYINRAFSGAMGYELKYSMTSGKLHVMASYSYYTPSRKNAVPEMKVSGNMSRQYLGMASMKATLIAGFQIRPEINIHVSGIFQGGFTTYEISDYANETTVAIRNPQTTLLNAGVRYSPPKHSKLIISATCSNILNRPFYVGSPFNNGLPGLPMFHRSVNLTMIYRLPL
jgi:outer membrane receptor protein involved in Fe transport